MKILILTDGEIFNGGYSTIAYKLNNILKKNKQETELYTFISNEKEIYDNNEIYIPKFKLNNHAKNKILKIINNKFNKIFCTSPWSLYFCSLFIKKNIFYFKGGGLRTDNKIQELKNTSILDVKIDDYWDNKSIILENKAKKNIDKLVIIPTTNLMYKLLKKSKYFCNNNIEESMDFLFYEYKSHSKNEKKIYDIIFIVSNHNRIVKNSNFVYQIYEKFPKLNKLVIGLNCENYNNLANTLVINKIISNDEINKYLLKSKIILIPSYFDTGPSVFIEALLNNCLPMCYFNCGYSNINLNNITIKILDLSTWINNIDSIIHKFNTIIFHNKNLQNIINRDKTRFIKLLYNF